MAPAHDPGNPRRHRGARSAVEPGSGFCEDFLLFSAQIAYPHYLIERKKQRVSHGYYISLHYFSAVECRAMR